jgi:peptidoglycan/LPS O-acetylase OafA/YrhL
MRTKVAHVPALDGVRGLAIALVFARHLSLVPWFRLSSSAADQAIAGVAGAGWIGVDLFFVLSGFLITGVLLDDRERAAPMSAKLGRFYWRRTLRIMPLYYVACAILFFVVPALPYFRAQPEIAMLHQSEPWYWLYGVNLLDVIHGGAWTPFNTGHFWSLAVEEQFYLVWPLIVLATSRKTLVRVVAGLIVAGPFVRMACLAFLGGAGPSAAYTISFARVDVLGAGALLAIMYRGDRDRWKRLQTATPWFGAIALMIFTLIAVRRGVDESHDPVMQTLGYSVVALGMGSLVAGLLRVDNATAPLGRIFSAAPLRTLGKYSYCLYIVHYPLMAVMDLAWPHVHIPPMFGSQLPAWAAYGAVLASSSFAIAWVSWRLLESPMLALKDRFNRTPLLSAVPPYAPPLPRQTYRPLALESDAIAMPAVQDP